MSDRRFRSKIAAKGLTQLFGSNEIEQQKILAKLFLSALVLIPVIIFIENVVSDTDFRYQVGYCCHLIDA
jgi:hypothetical protein